VFPKYGNDWRHFRGDAVAAAQPYDADHTPVIGWRMVPAIFNPTAG